MTQTTKGHEAFVRSGDLTHAVKTLNVLTFFRDFILPELDQGQSASTTTYDVKAVTNTYVTTDAYAASLLRSFGGIPAVRYTLEDVGHDHALITHDDVRCYIDQTREKITTLIAA